MVEYNWSLSHSDNWKNKVALAEMMKGGVIMDVVTVDHAKIAEDAGAVAVMALERVPADIRSFGGVARMSDPSLIKKIKESVSIPVMAKCRIGHFAEAMILQALKIDFVDESEVLTPADDKYHINKNDFIIPFVCGCRNIGEALRRISEGAVMIRTKGEAGTGDIVEAVKHLREIKQGIKKIINLADEEIVNFSKELGVSVDVVEEVRRLKKLPVPNFSAGGVATPADVALMRYLGAESVFVGSGIFKSEKPEQRAKAIVDATTYFDDPKKLLEISYNLGEPMTGIAMDQIIEKNKLANRGN